MATGEKRRIGRTDLHVTVLGFGTGQGGSRIQVSREESEAMVRTAWDAGVRYVDTAPFYGVGASERRVGDALRDKPRGEWVLSTKVGRLLKPRRGQDASTDGRTAPLPFTVEITTRMTKSCDRSRTAISGWVWTRSTSCMCTISAGINTRMRRPRI